MLAFFIPILFLFSLSSKLKLFYRFISFFFFILFSFALIFSYTRAAWVSLFGAMILGLFIKLKLKLKHVLVFCALFFMIVFPFKNHISSIVLDNNQDSSSSFSEHIKSIYNIRSDASNMERINRWKCAVNMFKEKPILGFGPGTYQFQYGGFQMHKNKTIISTNTGDMGNAHSEYLGALSETGFLGLGFFLLFIGSVFQKGISLYYSEKNNLFQTYLLGSIIGLMTYFMHGLFNNFLDMDKAAIPIWFFVAIIVSVDFFRSKI
jgi:O-antigen ligase